MVPTLGQLQTGIRYFGYVTAGINIAYGIYNISDYGKRGGNNKWVYAKYATDILVTAIGCCTGPFGVCVSLVCFMTDLCTDGFGIDYSTSEPVIRKEDD